MLRWKAQESCVHRDALPFRNTDDERTAFRSRSQCDRHQPMITEFGDRSHANGHGALRWL